MPPQVRGVIVRDDVLAPLGQIGILDVIRFEVLREEDARRWSGNEYHREVVSDDPQKLVIVDASGRLLEYVLNKGSFWALLYDQPGYVGVQGTGIRPGPFT